MENSKQETKLEVRQLEDNDLAKLSLREKLNSYLRFGRLPLKEGEPRPGCSINAATGKGVIARSNGAVLCEWSLAELVENGKLVRFALIGYRRLLRERNILQGVRDNRDLELIVNSIGSEVVLYGFDAKARSRVQRYQLAREISLPEIGVTLTTLPKKLADAVELGKKVEDNFLSLLKTARKQRRAYKVAALERLGVELGILQVVPVAVSKPEAKPQSGDSGKAAKRRRRNRRRKSAPKAEGGTVVDTKTVQPQAAPAASLAADGAPAEAGTAPAKTKRRRRNRRRKSAPKAEGGTVIDTKTVQSQAAPAASLAADGAPAEAGTAPAKKKRRRRRNRNRNKKPQIGGSPVSESSAEQQ